MSVLRDMLGGMPATDDLTAVTLVLGSEEFLAQRAVDRVIAAVRAGDPDADVHDLPPGALVPGMLANLTSPSLFATRSVVIVRAAQDLPPAVATELITYLAAPEPAVALVLVHKGGPKGNQLLEAARTRGATVIHCGELKRYADKIAFVRSEIRAAGRQLTEDAARSLLDAVGGDLRELANACGQLVADTTGVIDDTLVRRYYAGRAEVTSFMVADNAIEGRLGEALANLRWALGSGVDPVLVTSALAMGLRNVARFGSAPRGLRPADLARELGLPSWKVDRLRHQVRGWTPQGVSAALQAVAEADMAVKGAATSADYALERAVISIARARR
jgi:DNA polymerase III delta subunit